MYNLFLSLFHYPSVDNKYLDTVTVCQLYINKSICKLLILTVVE